MIQKVLTKIKKCTQCIVSLAASLVDKVSHCEQSACVSEKVSMDGSAFRKAKSDHRSAVLPYKEAELLKDLTSETAHVDALAIITTRDFKLD